MVLHSHHSHHSHQGYLSHHVHPVHPGYTLFIHGWHIQGCRSATLASYAPPHPWMELRALSTLPVSKSYTPSIDGTVRRISGSTGALGAEAIPPPIDEPLPIDETRFSVE